MKFSIDSSPLYERLTRKSQILIIFGDDNGNKFGYYFNGTVNKLDDWIKSSGSFMFSLNSNGRFNGMIKFEQKECCYGLWIDKSSSSKMFGLIWGFCINKNGHSESKIREDKFAFDFHGLSNIFLPNSSGGKKWKTFTSKRVTVIQMI